MNWFDAGFGAVLIALIWSQARGELGKALLDTLSTVFALVLAHQGEATVAQFLHWQGPHSSAGSARAFLLVFLGLWSVLMLAGRLIHSQTRFSLDQVDRVFCTVLGIVMAVLLAHVVTSTGARLAIERNDRIPEYLRDSWIATEFRNFRTPRMLVRAQAEAQGRTASRHDQ